MKLVKARVKGYRSIIDSGYFDIEELKTILVGPNEAGKTAILQALQKLNPPEGIEVFNILRDYPRSMYDEDITQGGIDAKEFTVVEGCFELDEDDKLAMPEGFENIKYIYGKKLDNTTWHSLENAPTLLFSEISNDLTRLLSHMDETSSKINETNTAKETTKATPAINTPSDDAKETFPELFNTKQINENIATSVTNWLDKNIKFIDEDNTKENDRFEKLKLKLMIPLNHKTALTKCKNLLPKFVLFNNYYKIKPSIHLLKLAERVEQNLLDDKQYDYGNVCLLKFLKFTARELSTLGDVSKFNVSQLDQIEKMKEQIDTRDQRLNGATIRLTKEIINVWNPKNDAKDAHKLRIKADGQYLKVVVEDELGVEVELDQRSEGFQWLVSFFVVFFAEANEKHLNTILLLDEPGTSLHGLKQVEFQETITKLSQKNQTIFTTHSPFMIGANELDKVRVVEMTDRSEGTKVHTTVTAVDGGAMLPLQEALGYDLAQSLFFHKKNLVLEGLTDYWYIEAIAEMLNNTNHEKLDEKISLLPANCASKVVYYATILHAQNLKVAALLDSDAEGETAAKQDTLIHALGNNRILRTKSIYSGDVTTPEIEDLFRNTLLKIAKEKLGWDAHTEAEKQCKRPVVDILKSVAGKDFSKAQLAKAFIRWTAEHEFKELSQQEQEFAIKLISKINVALK